MREIPEKWRTHVARWRESGLTQAAYCKAEGLHPVTFGAWKRRLFPTTQAAVSFMELPALGVPLVAASFRLKVCGVRVDVPAGFDAEGLRRLLSVLREPA